MFTTTKISERKTEHLTGFYSYEKLSEKKFCCFIHEFVGGLLIGFRTMLSMCILVNACTSLNSSVYKYCSN